MATTPLIDAPTRSKTTPAQYPPLPCARMLDERSKKEDAVSPPSS